MRKLSNFLFRYRYGLLFLSGITLVVYWQAITTPSIFGDEWTFIAGYLGGGLECPSMEAPRPLHYCPYIFLAQLLGVNIVAYKIFVFVLAIVQFLLLLCLFDLLLPERTIFNSVIVALFIVYPTFWAQTFMFGMFILIGCLVTLGFIGVLLFINHGRVWTLIGGLGLILISFWIYENAVGISIGYTLILLIAVQNRTGMRRYALITPALLAVSYSVWRFLIQLQVGTAYGHASGDILLEPMGLIAHIIDGYRVNLQWGWTVTMLRFFPWLNTGGDHQSALASLILVGVIFSFAVLLTLVGSPKTGKNLKSSTEEPISKMLKEYGLIGLIGLGILGAGYYPVILVEAAGLSFISSRNNYFPAIGASIALGAGLMFLLALLGNQGRRAEVNLLWLAAPLIVLGMVRQGMVQNETFQGWKEQKAIWQQMFLAAPDYAPGTVVFLRMPHYPDYEGARPFESGTWGFSGALTLLYGHPVQGYFAYPDFGARFTPEGIAHPGSAALIPYSKVVLFTYDRETRRLSLESNLPEEVKSLAGPARLCDDCVLNRPANQVKYRALVK